MTPSPASIIPPEFDGIFSSPVGIVSDYGQAPEYCGTRCFPDHSPPPEDYEIQILGKRPETIPVKAKYARVPVPQVHELSHPLWYDGFIFSQTGDLFVDSAREYLEEPLRITCFRGLDNQEPRPHEGGLFLMPPPRRKQMETKRYGGQYMPFFTINHYGHYLMESVSMLWVLEHGLKPALILHNALSRVPDCLLGLVEPFGLDESSFIIPEPFASFETVFMQRRSYMHRHYFGLAAQKVFYRIAEYYAQPDDQWPKRIYLSRRKMGTRRLLNEAECEELFQRYGFTVVNPEELTVARQAALFARATHVAGPQGSALHNRVLSLEPRGLKVLILAMPPLFTPFPMIERVYGRPATVVMGRPVFQSPVHYEASTWTMPLDNLEIGLRQWLDS